MDKLVRKIEIPMARSVIEKAGLYIAQKKDLDHTDLNLKEKNSFLIQTLCTTLW